MCLLMTMNGFSYLLDRTACMHGFYLILRAAAVLMAMVITILMKKKMSHDPSQRVCSCCGICLSSVESRKIVIPITMTIPS